MTIIALVTILAAGAATHVAWRWWNATRFIETTNDAQVQADITVVSSRLQGYVTRLYVTDNQRVRVGDVMATVDGRELAERAQQAHERVQAQRAVLAGISNRIARQRAAVDEAVAALDAAAAARQQSMQDFARYQALARGDVVSRQRLDAAEADARRTAADVQRAQARISGEKSELAALETERARNDALLNDAESALEIARIDLADTEIRAPVDGVVGNRVIRMGQFLRPGMGLWSIVPVTGVYVVANFKETQLARMRPGQKAEIKADALPGEKIHGTVDSFSPATGSLFSLLPSENASGNFTKVVQRLPIRVAVSASESLARMLRPGLSVTVAVDTRSDEASTATVANQTSARVAVSPTASIQH
ncbi:MAG: HlyD family secretion protein [Rhodopila sp.]